MTERRFNEAEVAAIFERAAEAQQAGLHHLPSGEGMTLTDLQEIGREVGISHEQLAHAAKAIELGDCARSISVGSSRTRSGKDLSGICAKPSMLAGF